MIKPQTVKKNKGLEGRRCGGKVRCKSEKAWMRLEEQAGGNITLALQGICITCSGTELHKSKLGESSLLLAAHALL